MIAAAPWPDAGFGDVAPGGPLRRVMIATRLFGTGLR